MKHLRMVAAYIACWFDTHAFNEQMGRSSAGPVGLIRILPFISLHLGLLGVLWVGWSWVAIAVAVGLYLVRMFAITGFYHRYFSHRTFKTSRPVQFAFALIANSSAQRGPLWWAAQHRHHHRHSDRPEDVHSPHHHGLWWSHVGWITSRDNFRTNIESVRDLARYRELVLLDRFDCVGPLLLIGMLYALGAWLQGAAPQLGTSGPQLVVWGFVVSTVVLFHATCAINSLAHTVGHRSYDTPDESRNSLLLALFTLGEGWHNNHHRYPGCTPQGFMWWQIDPTWYALKLLSWTGLVWNLRPVPEAVRREKRFAGRP